MHIHKPKALHGWREFLGEIGVIVCGVLIAIALEQTVETLHRHAQAREMIRKLREESLENRRVIAYDFGVCGQRLPEMDKDIALVSVALRSGRLPAAPETLSRAAIFVPADTAWITIRDSALLPIMPKLTVDNYWKLDTTSDALQTRNQAANEDRRRLQALIQTAHQRPMDQAFANDLLLSLNQGRADEQSYCNMLGNYSDENETALAGKTIDIEGELKSFAGRSNRPT
jgi:hypothetical protein